MEVNWETVHSIAAAELDVYDSLPPIVRKRIQIAEDLIEMSYLQWGARRIASMWGHSMVSEQDCIQAIEQMEKENKYRW